MVLESSAKQRLGCQFGSPGLLCQKIQEPLTQGTNLLRVLGAKSFVKLMQTTHSNISSSKILCFGISSDLIKMADIMHKETYFCLVDHLALSWGHLNGVEV